MNNILEKLKDPEELSEPKSIEDKVVEWLKRKVNPAEITRILAAAIDCEIEDREDAVKKLTDEIQEAIKNGDITSELRIKDGTIVNSQLSDSLRNWLRERMVDGIKLNTPETIGKWVLTLYMDSTMKDAETGEEINEQLNADLTPLINKIDEKELDAATYDGEGTISVYDKGGKKVSVKIPIAGFGGNIGLISWDDLSKLYQLHNLGIEIDSINDILTIDGRKYKLERLGASVDIYAGWYKGSEELTQDIFASLPLSELLTMVTKDTVYTNEQFRKAGSGDYSYKAFLCLYPVASVDISEVDIYVSQIMQTSYVSLIRQNVTIDNVEYKVFCVVPNSVTSNMSAYVTLKEL